MRRKTRDYAEIHDILTEVAEGVRSTRNDIAGISTEMDHHSKMLRELHDNLHSIQAESASIRDMLTTPARWVA